MPAVDNRGNLHARFENCWRLPCLWWTVWETSTQAVDRMGDFHTSHGQHGTLPRLLRISWETSKPVIWMAWETSLSFHHYPVGASP